MSRSSSVTELVERARSGDKRALGRLISLVEGDAPERRDVLRALPGPGHAHVVGLTGAPGVGKSTMTNALVRELRASGRRVGVLAIDPSSPFTGGALLGDRIRMSDHTVDEGVFIRSMASRGHLGGISASTSQALRVLDAVGFDVVLVETVGVGQSEVEIAALADTTVVLLAPGMGDGVQAAKAGILEVGDLYVVNKSDQDGADKVRRELIGMLRLSDRPDGAWRPSVLATTAPTDEGVPEAVSAIGEHGEWLTSSGELSRRRVRRVRDEIEAIAVSMVRSRWDGITDRDRIDQLAEDVMSGELDPYTAADALLDES